MKTLGPEIARLVDSYIPHDSGEGTGPNQAPHVPESSSRDFLTVRDASSAGSFLSMRFTHAARVWQRDIPHRISHPRAYRLGFISLTGPAKFNCPRAQLRDPSTWPRRVYLAYDGRNSLLGFKNFIRLDGQHTLKGVESFDGVGTLLTYFFQYEDPDHPNTLEITGFAILHVFLNDEDSLFVELLTLHDPGRAYEIFPSDLSSVPWGGRVRVPTMEADVKWGVKGECVGGIEQIHLMPRSEDERAEHRGELTTRKQTRDFYDGKFRKVHSHRRSKSRKPRRRSKSRKPRRRPKSRKPRRRSKSRR